MVTVCSHMGTANPSNKICGRTVEMHEGSGGHGHTMFIHLGLAVPTIVVSLEGGKINILILAPKTKESSGRAMCDSQVAPGWKIANGESIRVGAIGQEPGLPQGKENMAKTWFCKKETGQSILTKGLIKLSTNAWVKFVER